MSKTMKHESIKIERFISEKDIEFSIVKGKEAEAAAYLPSILNEDNEIYLANDHDENGEGITCVRLRNGEFQFMNGGHGWQGEWKVISVHSLKELIMKLSSQNNGSHWSLIAKYKG